VIRYRKKHSREYESQPSDSATAELCDSKSVKEETTRKVEEDKDGG
jgi:hypothetical protein